MSKSIKNFYPKDMTFCMYGDECPIICPRKISDYEINLLNFEVNWADFKHTTECHLGSEEQ